MSNQNIPRTQRYTDYLKTTCKNYAKPQNTEIKFMTWMDDIEDLVFKALNLNLLDISDQDYMVMFGEGYTAYDVADYIINGEFNNYF